MMGTISRPETLFESLVDRVSATTTGEYELLTYKNADEALRKRWLPIEDKLLEWGRSAEIRDGDDENEFFVSPTKQAIDVAIDAARQLTKKGYPPPTRAVPNGEGGIVFERDQNDETVEIEIYRDATIQIRTFKDCSVIYETQPLSISPKFV